MLLLSVATNFISFSNVIKNVMKISKNSYLLKKTRLFYNVVLGGIVERCRSNLPIEKKLIISINVLRFNKSNGVTRLSYKDEL